MKKIKLLLIISALLVAIPTAIPEDPLISNAGILAGKTVGS